MVVQIREVEMRIEMQMILLEILLLMSNSTIPKIKLVLKRLCYLVKSICYMHN